MLHVNDEHNDELFRRAAEQYPLKTDGADWEKVRALLEKPADDEPPPVIPSRRRRRYWFLLLLLIPLTIAEINTGWVRKQFSGEGTKSKTGDHNSNSTVKNASTSVNNTVTIAVNSNAENANTVNIDAQTKDPANATNLIADPIVAADNSNSAVQSTTTTTSPDETVTTRKRIGGKSKSKSRFTVSPGLLSDENTDGSIVSKKPNRNKKPSGSSKEKQRATITDPGTETANESKDALSPDQSPKTNTVEKNITTAKDIAATEPPIIKDPASEKKKEEVVQTKDDSANNVQEIQKTVAAKDKKQKKAKQKHFYVGIVAGPDFSAIKLQSIDKVGFNYGALLGYRINKKFAFETGLLNERKLYQTAGKYFTPKTPLPYPNATIGAVTGECRMLEWPLNITYRFGKKSTSQWFVLAGTSSYFMNSEYYAYDVTYYGNNYPYSSRYKNKSTIMFAMINFGIGYTRKLGKFADLRIEPYAKLPVKKIGSGSLPIQSGGILIGLTKTIF